MLFDVTSPGRRAGPSVLGVLVCAVLLAACCHPAHAGESGRSAEEQARALAGEVLRKAGDGDADSLGAWTRSVIERALDRAHGTASETNTDGQTSAAPLPAEKRSPSVAAGLAGRPNAPEILVFMSLSVPAVSWEQWARDAARFGAPLLLRGVGETGFRETVREVGSRLDGHETGVAIDPRLFRLFGIERVPAVVAVPGGVPPCASRGCGGDAPPPHDRVTGNIGLAAALEEIAAEGHAGRDAARQRLEHRRGGN